MALVRVARDPAQRLELISALQEKWSQSCEPDGAIEDVTFVFTAEDEMTVAQLRRTESLDLEFLSSQDGID